MTIISGINPNNYTNYASIDNNNPDFSTARHRNGSIYYYFGSNEYSKLPTPEVGERYLQADAQSCRLYTGTYIDPNAGELPSYQLEVSYAMFSENISGPSCIITTNYTTVPISVSWYNSELVVIIDGTVDADFVHFVGKPVTKQNILQFMTVRVQFSDPNSADPNPPRLQVFLDGNLIYDNPDIVLASNSSKKRVYFEAREGYGGLGSIVVHDEWTTDPLVAPAPMKIIETFDEYSVATEEVPLSYYNTEQYENINDLWIGHELLAAYGADGYVDTAAIRLNPDVYSTLWDVHKQQIIPEPAEEQQWFYGPNRTSDISLRPDMLSTPINKLEEVELSWAVARTTINTSTSSSYTMTPISNFLGSAYLKSELYLSGHFQLQCAYSGYSAFRTIYNGNPFPLNETNPVVYFTIRIKTPYYTFWDSAKNPEQVIELWGNGVLLGSYAGFYNGSVGTTDATAFITTLGTSYASSYLVGHLTAWSRFSTPLGTPPKVYAVTNDGAQSDYNPDVTEVDLGYFGRYIPPDILGFTYMTNPGPGIIM